MENMPNVSPDFEPEEYIPLLHSLSGETHAENVAHVTARVALLNLVIADQRVRERFSQWSDATDVGRHAARLTVLIDELVDRAGRDIRSDLWERCEFDIEVDSDQDLIDFERRLKDAEVVALAMVTSLGEMEGNKQRRMITEDAIRLVRDEWDLPWPWLALELYRVWMLETISKPFNRVPEYTTWYEPSCPEDTPMPPFKYQFETRQGEPLGAAWDRFTHEFEETILPAFMQVWERTAIPSGRRSDPATITEYVSWFYRHKVRGESIRSIAGGDERRSHIRYGIRQVYVWLSVATFTWTSPPEK